MKNIFNTENVISNSFETIFYRMAGVDRPGFISEPDARFAGRLVYDVLMFTLEKCGLPDVRRIVTTLQPNVYSRPDFVQIAGVCSLRVALINRDSWRQMFISRHNSSGLVGLDIPLFISQIVKVSVFGRGKSLQSDVQTMLALCNEITLFFFSKRVDYDINRVIGSIGGSVFFLCRSHPNYRDALEGLFDKFANLQEYTKFLSNFTKKYAIPYGSREDVSDLFYQELRKRRINYVAKRRCQQDPSIKQLVDHLGFLPLNLFSKIKAEESEKYPQHIEAAVAAIPAAAGEFLNPPTSPISSESGAIGGQTSRRRHSTESMKQSEEQRSAKKKSDKEQATRSRKDSEQIIQPKGLFTKDSSELGVEDELRRLSLGAETTSQESQGAIPKRSQSSKDKGKSVKK
ncbi:hypothetical protein HNY73_019152 [Argiope bruennichi]|uniref:Uncharacterized protein n=1 Tax=Argiope bruennichi TaxID=94029 RepID=A0A8T0EGD4_ARGBR|nr:hypothetical protein HNY73_019152 [Argiope bruennichi]